MTIEVRGSSDEGLLLIHEALRAYEDRYPEAAIVYYRRNAISIRIRIIDHSFEELEKSERHARIWKYLENLPEDVQGDISMIVLLTPGEVGRSIGNLEFEDPTPSLIQ